MAEDVYEVFGIQGFREQVAEENIWTQERGSDVKLENVAY
jgi:hypothetical protein